MWKAQEIPADRKVYSGNVRLHRQLAFLSTECDQIEALSRRRNRTITRSRNRLVRSIYFDGEAEGRGISSLFYVSESRNIWSDKWWSRAAKGSSAWLRQCTRKISREKIISILSQSILNSVAKLFDNKVELLKPCNKFLFILTDFFLSFYTFCE